MSFSPGSPPWLHPLVSIIEHQHNLCVHSDMVGTESWLTKSRGGRAGKPFLPHLGDQPGLNWMSFLSHAILLCNTFSLFLFFSVWDDQKPALWCHLHFEVFCPFCCRCCILGNYPAYLAMLVPIALPWLQSILLTLGRICSPNWSQGCFLS